MNSGARKKNDWPLKAASVEPPTDMVDAAISTPSSRAPQSPMKILAGCTFHGRKPTQAPSTTTAMSGPMLPGASTPTSSRRSAVEQERPGGDGGDAGGEAVEAVDEVEGVGHPDDPAAP